MSDNTTDITFAYPVTTEDGKSHEPDATAAVPSEEAKQLLLAGLARAADETPAKSGGKPAPDTAATKEK